MNLKTILNFLVIYVMHIRSLNTMFLNVITVIKTVMLFYLFLLEKS